MNTRPFLVAIVAVALVVALAIAAVLYLAPRMLPGFADPPAALGRTLPSLAGASGWIGSDSLSADALRGHPSLLLVWTDTDPRSLDALRVAESWHRAFAPLGCRIVAVHAPDFAFASDRAVPERIAQSLGLTLPLALDATLQLQSALGGATDGPHLIVADGAGRVVLDTVGALAAAEQALRTVYGPLPTGTALPPLIAESAPVAVRTVYLGTGRVTGGPLKGMAAGSEHTFTTQFRYQEQGRVETPYPVGRWRVGADGVLALRAGAAHLVAIRYSAARVGVVVSPPSNGTGRLWLLLGERWPCAEECEADVAFDGRGAAFVEVTEPRLYWLEHGTGERVLRLSPGDAGLTIHAFVFEDAR